MRMESAEARLRYIDGSKVQTPGGLLDQLDVLNQEDSNVGRVEGIVVDPAERQVLGAQVELEHPVIDGPAKRFPPFTDDDLLTALFASRTH